jgi:hypothetical protein
MPFPHYYPPRADIADHTLVSFAAPVPAWSRQRPEWQIRSDCKLGHGKGHGGYFVTVLIPAAVQEDLDDDSEMWKMFMDEVKGEDNCITDAWKEDAYSIVTFVSLNLQLVPMFVSMTKLQDGSVLRSCWRIHH